MTTDIIIEQIQASITPGQLFEDLSSWKEKYRSWAKIIHPDVCSHPLSKTAFAKLNTFKDNLENGETYSDEACKINYKLNECTYTGDKIVIARSLNNYNYLRSFKDEASIHFHKYLPTTCELINDTTLIYKYPKRALPISSIKTLEQKHANWVLSRLLEFCGWLNQIGVCHAGITPDSIYIVPEEHGIICTSFYHVTQLDQRLRTISGKYSGFYPSTVLETKLAKSNIDIALSKRTAIYLLGDASGNGTVLRKTHNEEIIDYLQIPEYDPLLSYSSYRTLLKKHFNTKEFHKLTI